MGTKYLIKASPQMGRKARFRAGRGWTESGTEVEHDPLAEVDAGNVITTASLKLLRDDPAISVTVAGGEEAAETLHRRVVELEAKVADTASGLARARDAADAAGGRAAQLEREKAELLKRIDGLEVLVAQKSKLAAEAQAAVGTQASEAETVPESPEIEPPVSAGKHKRGR